MFDALGFAEFAYFSCTMRMRHRSSLGMVGNKTVVAIINEITDIMGYLTAVKTCFCYLDKRKKKTKSSNLNSL